VPAVREELATLRRWQADDTRLAVASVVATSQSAPRPPGATLALHPDGRVLGSVSGGCVEGAVVEVATEVLETGRPQRVRYGISDDDAMAVGLTCGGTIEVFVRPVDRQVLDLEALAARVEVDDAVATATIVEHAVTPDLEGRTLVVTDQGVEGTTGSEHLDRAVAEAALGMLALGESGLRHLGPQGERRRDDVAVFVESFAPRPRMLVFGAIDFAAAVASIGRYLGFHVTVCDARGRFATPGGSPTPTRSSSSGPTATSPRPRWTSAPSSAC
jgi:xanthine dehydrogenase accessory factor